MKEVSEAEELELVRQTIHHNPHAFRQIILLYERPLLTYLYGILGNWEDTRDIAQETFIAAYYALPRWASPQKERASRQHDDTLSSLTRLNASLTRPLAPWLYRIATNRALNFLKKHSHLKYTPSTKDNDTDQDIEHPRILHNIMSMEEQYAEREVLRIALDHLSEEVAACIILRFICNETYAEIADRLGLTTEAVRKRISRGLVVLRSAYELLNKEISS